eukprot:TRINITY_DN3194_c0_g1_i1.p1 TRINITY_DN3194_c0_g1~~TRINITY_DN3194_c0_g1_i1.p1  ORF type:complete len:492 (+),score=48.36 TRINITY_DN3194_c0_g1_i1:149-1624(+)
MQHAKVGAVLLATTGLVTAIRHGLISLRSCFRVAKWTGAAVGGVIVLYAVTMAALLRQMFTDIKFVPPTGSQIMEDRSKSALFRLFPELWGRIAWRSLGVFPTAMHRCTVKSAVGGQPLRFVAKREDTCDPLYGGNKVRTLEHQLACAEAHLHQTGGDLVVVGSPGSNQCVAAIVHGGRLNLPVQAAWLSPEEADRDNALNLLSQLSFGVKCYPIFARITLMPRLFRAAFGDRHLTVFFGGNNPTGAIGHVSAALEVAEDVAAGRSPDPAAIFLPIGSSCTASGLCVGIAAARHLGLPAFRQEGFRMHGVITHPDNAFINNFGILKWVMRKVVRGVCAAIRDAGGPDLTAAAVSVLDNELVCHGKYSGKYGAHTKASLAAKELCSSGTIEDQDGTQATPLWLCSTFSAKAMGVMLDYLEGPLKGKDVIFWATKSLVQPSGDDDAWQRCLREQPSAVQKWVKKGGVHGPDDFHSVARPMAAAVRQQAEQREQ